MVEVSGSGGQQDTPDPFAGVVGQDEAVAELRAGLARPVHAYLLVGPPGCGSREAARAFAGELLAADAVAEGDLEGAQRHRRLAAAEAHPDLEVTEREGPFITRDQARAIVTSAARSPAEGNRKVLLLTEFHLVVDAAPILLKAIEEPPPTVTFLILADEVPPELVTIASRCVVVRFRPLTTEAIVARLVVEGAPLEAAAAAAAFAAGDLSRARLVVNDTGLAERVARWSSVPERLDGTGAAVAALTAELLTSLDESLAPLDARHAAELAALAEDEQRYGLRSNRRGVEERQRRERRRYRTDELRFGLSVIARAVRDRVAATTAAADPVYGGAVAPSAGQRGGAGGVGGRGAAARGLRDPFASFAAIQATAESLERNPNERLALQRLLVHLVPLAD